MNEIESAFRAAGFALIHQGGGIENWQRNADGYIQIISDEDGGGPVDSNNFPVSVGTYRVDAEGVMVEDDFDNCALLADGWTADAVIAEAHRQAAKMEG